MERQSGPSPCLMSGRGPAVGGLGAPGAGFWATHGKGREKVGFHFNESVRNSVGPCTDDMSIQLDARLPWTLYGRSEAAGVPGGEEKPGEPCQSGRRFTGGGAGHTRPLPVEGNISTKDCHSFVLLLSIVGPPAR